MKRIRLTTVALIATLLLAACGETDTRKEINRRRAALKEKQKTELRKAQEELRLTDSALQATGRELDSMQQAVEKHKRDLRATPEELTLLTRTRVRRDSIRTQAEALGMKIRYIRKKMDEGE